MQSKKKIFEDLKQSYKEAVENEQDRTHVHQRMHVQTLSQVLNVLIDIRDVLVDLYNVMDTKHD